MTKVKLADGTIINASAVELDRGVLKITTSDDTVEALAELFSDKEKTSLITLLTESEIETGYKKGFTSFAGIDYDADGAKTIALFQPVDVTEARVSSAEGTANLANDKADELEETVNAILGAEVE